jgi:hypothetical protein
MSVTSPQFADNGPYLDQIEKLTHSHTLRKAESLCKLLRYLADNALSQPGVPLKEYQIATEVFGRPDDFDPQADSAIRVQAGRLRLKLHEYYSHEGVADTVVAEMPSGSYALNFHHREPPAPIILPSPPKLPLPVEADWPGKSARAWIIVVAALCLALAAASGVVATLLVARNSAGAGKPNESPAPAALRTFWSPFASGSEVPWVIFSNAAFVGRPETGMRYLDPARDSHEFILDHYTGVGEVLAVHELDRVFNWLNHPLRVKRGSLFSLDDAKRNDLIFVGSPAENLTLLDLPGTQEFVFKRFDSGPRKGDLGLINAHPEPGQPAIFYPSDASQPLVEDYAIVALVRGLNSARHVMILAGTTTIGTQAAVEYVCARDSVEELLRRLALRAGDDLKPFEALLRVKVTRGVPVSVQLVAVRNGRQM